MIRSFILALALSTSLVAIGSGPAFAQSTDQTDRSEEDWRKSQKKRDTSDIFEGIVNSRTSGWGTTQGPVSPVDSLPEESRRHLMRERARVIANTNPGETAKAEYKPSEAAKTDADLETQEKVAWDVIVTDLKGGGQGAGPAQDGLNKIAVAGQGGGEDDSNRGSSAMRGGSSQSVADILAQIKGMKSAGGGSGGGAVSTQGAGESGEVQRTQDGRSQQQGQNQQGQQQDQSQQGQSQTQNQGQSSADGDNSQNQDVGDSAEEDSATNDASAQSNNTADAQARASAKADAQAQAQSRPDPVSPLERIKNREDGNGGGQRTSATDYLNKSE